MQKTPNFKLKTRQVPVLVAFSGLLLCIAGLFVFVEGNVVGVVPFILGLNLAFTYMGYEIDFERKRYKEFISIAGIQFGFWQSVSHFDFIFVRKVELKGWFTRVVYKVFMKDREKREGIELATMKTEEEAIEFGKYLSENLDFGFKTDLSESY